MRLKYKRGHLVIAIVLVLLATSNYTFFAITKPETQAEPLTRALRQYHQMHGTYPDALSQLVNDGLISYLPSVGSSFSVQRSGFVYFVDTELDLYTLSFTETPWASLKVETKVYTSYGNRWINQSDSIDYDFTEPLILAMDRTGSLYRALRSWEALRAFAMAIRKYNKIPNSGVTDRQIIRAIGFGEFVERDGRIFLFYSCSDKPGSAYLFEVSQMPADRNVFGTKIIAILESGQEGGNAPAGVRP